MATLMLGTAVDDPLRQAFLLYFAAARSNAFETLEEDPKAKVTFEQESDRFGHRARKIWPDFDYCKVDYSTGSSTNMTECYINFARTSEAELAFDRLESRIRSFLGETFKEKLYLASPMPSSLGLALRQVTLRQSPDQPTVSMGLNVSFAGVVLFVDIFPPSERGPPGDRYLISLTGSDNPDLADAYCQVELRDNQYQLITTPGFWKPDFPWLLREFFLLHELAHIKLGHLEEREGPGFDDTARERQEVEADQYALGRLAGMYTRSFDVINARLETQAEAKLRPTPLHPAPGVRLRQMLRAIAEARLLNRVALPSFEGSGSPIDLDRETVSAHKVDLTYRNYSAVRQSCKVYASFQEQSNFALNPHRVQYARLWGEKRSFLKSLPLSHRFEAGESFTFHVDYPVAFRSRYVLFAPNFESKDEIKCDAF